MRAGTAQPEAGGSPVPAQMCLWLCSFEVHTSGDSLDGNWESLDNAVPLQSIVARDEWQYFRHVLVAVCSAASSVLPEADSPVQCGAPLFGLSVTVLQRSWEDVAK